MSKPRPPAIQMLNLLEDQVRAIREYRAEISTNLSPAYAAHFGQQLRNAALALGAVVRLLDEDGEHSELWTNDGEPGFPEVDPDHGNYVPDPRFDCWHDLTRPPRRPGPSNWVIYNKQEGLFWSNTDGWVDLESATVFLTRERNKYAPPMGGEWVDAVTSVSLLKEEPDGCECDNTHQANDTVCRWCWHRGRRHWDDPEIQ